MSRSATIRATRRLGDGSCLINIVCPICDGRHWIPEAVRGECPRKPGQFTVNHRTRRNPR